MKPPGVLIRTILAGEEYHDEEKAFALKMQNLMLDERGITLAQWPELAMIVADTEKGLKE